MGRGGRIMKARQSSSSLPRSADNGPLTIPSSAMSSSVTLSASVNPIPAGCRLNITRRPLYGSPHSQKGAILIQYPAPSPVKLSVNEIFRHRAARSRCYAVTLNPSDLPSSDLILSPVMVDGSITLRTLNASHFVLPTPLPSQTGSAPAPGLSFTTSLVRSSR